MVRTICPGYRIWWLSNNRSAHERYLALSGSADVLQRRDIKPLPIGLALSGGTAKAIAHVGVPKALEQERKKPSNNGRAV